MLMLNKSVFSPLVIISVLILSSGCHDNKRSVNSLTEGIIEYDAEVIDKSQPMAGLVPNSAIMNFKNNKFGLEMSTIGFSTTFISDPARRTLTQLVKFMNIENACIQQEADLALENKAYELKLEETKDTKKIAGYTCKKVKATMVKNPAVSFDVYYTDELGSDSINELSPYKQIKGMLMQYRLKKFGLELCFTAKTVKKEEIKDEAIETPSHYKIVSQSEMEQLFADIRN